MSPRKGKWPLIWLRRWDKAQEESSKERQYYREYNEDPRRDEQIPTGRVYPILDNE